MASELHGEADDGAGSYDEATARQAWDDLLQERWKGQRHALWGEQLSQAMLNYALHATTQNRDEDPAECRDVDFGAFDGGPPRTERPDPAATDAARTDGGHDGD